jgi:hypothetical protein
MTIQPVLQALVLADQVYVDARTGTKVIAGTFNRLWGRRFPTTYGRTSFAFMCLTEVHGRVELRLVYRDLSDNRELMAVKNLAVQAQDPLVSIEIMVEIPPFPMPHAGAFAFEVHCGDEVLGSLRVMVSQVPPGATGKAETGEAGGD